MVSGEDGKAALELSATHWAPAGAEVVDGPSVAGPVAGGAKRDPAVTSRAEDWEWELKTVIEPSASAGFALASLALQKGDERAHRGGCHCGAVRFEVIAPSKIIAWDCNCSNCRMRRYCDE